MPRPTSRLTALLVLLAGLAQTSATLMAQDADPRLNPTTGAMKANWAPAADFDHKHLRLELDMGDLSKATLSGVATFTLASRGTARSQVRLDAGPGLTVERVEFPERTVGRNLKEPARPVPFVREGRDLIVTLPTPAKEGESFDLRVIYSADYSSGRGEGLTYLKPNEKAESETDRFPIVYSQGQAEHHHKWFPCHDFPNERATTELILTVPTGYEAVSNGRLVSRTADRGRTTFHWLQDKHHPYYLVTLVVGKYTIINLDPERPNARPDMSFPREDRFRLPVTAYVPIGREEDGRRVLKDTWEMIGVFEKVFDEPYPWDKYTQVMVRGFGGGMENTSATTMYAELLNARGRQGDDIIAHELAHQWFGDLVTCRTWAHLWLNEGWATYSEAIWAEHVDGDEGYMRTVTSWMSQQRMGNRGSLPRAIPMVSNRYTNPDQPFQKADNPYSKGALVLHALREKLGKEVFFRGAALYLDRHKERGLAETDDFRRALEDVSGVPLDRFFDQWTLRPGLARVDLKLGYEDGSLTIEATQTQKIDSDNPAYVMTVPVRIKYEDGTTDMMSFEIAEKSARAVLRVKGRPAEVSFDPRLTNLSVYNVSQPLASAEPMER